MTDLLQELKTKASNDKRDGACTTAFDTSQPHLEYQFTDPTAWGDVKRLLLQVFELGLVKGEKSKVRVQCYAFCQLDTDRFSLVVRNLVQRLFRSVFQL